MSSPSIRRRAHPRDALLCRNSVAGVRFGYVRRVSGQRSRWGGSCLPIPSDCINQSRSARKARSRRLHRVSFGFAAMGSTAANG